MRIDRSVFRWDGYSDQPATIDRRSKGRLRRLAVRDEPRKWLAALASARPVLARLVSARRFEAYRNDHRIGLCINLERPVEDKRTLSAAEIADIIRPLNLARVAVRIPLHDIDRLDEYVAFIRHFGEYEILAVVLQDRAFIEDPDKLERALRRIFTALEFFEVAWNLRNREFPDRKLLGGAVIDFDLHEHFGALYNRFPFAYDGYASLLYVDRRGAPENRQFGFDLSAKIDLLARAASGSGKVAAGEDPSLWITEVNWPLLDTGRYAPAMGGTRVGETEQLRFLVRYCLLALASGSVAACYWHQLVAPGYGLIDNRGGAVRIRPAFNGLATLCRLFNGALIEGFRRQDELGYYRLAARQDGAEVLAVWRVGGSLSIPLPPGKTAIGIEGETLDIAPGQPVAIDDSTVYLVDA